MLILLLTLTIAPGGLPDLKAMRVHGVDPYIINGTLNAEARAHEVDRFIHSSEESRRVLLFSSVGAAGLNLACADVVILYVRDSLFRTSLPN
jgi:hypothetical protein